MSEQRFDLYFSGKIIAGEDPALVRARVGKLFAADPKTLERLFSGQPTCIKTNVDQERAIHYRVALREAGALLEIRAKQRPDTADEPRSGPAKARAAGLSLLPAKTGTLADCAPAVAAAPIPDVSAIELLPPGSNIDTASPPPPAVIAADRFTLSEANSGTLEDCQQKTRPAPVPDISHLKIIDA